MLEPQELKRRIDAARTLRGLRQIDLAELLEADGHGKTDVGRLERGELRFSASLRRSLAYHLGVSEEWFTAVDVDEALGRGGDAAAGLDAKLDAVHEEVAASRRERADVEIQMQGLLEEQNKLLKRQEALLANIEALVLSETVQDVLEAARQVERTHEQDQSASGEAGRASGGQDTAG